MYVSSEENLFICVTNPQATGSTDTLSKEQKCNDKRMSIKAKWQPQITTKSTTNHYREMQWLEWLIIGLFQLKHTETDEPLL